MAYSDEELHNLSDEELEAAFREAKQYEPEEELVEDMEQPVDDVDSDDDASAEEETEEESEENVEAEDEGEPDEGTEEAEETPAEEETKVEDKAQPVPSKYSFKANGKEYEFTEDEIKAQFPKIFGQAMDYTKKMQSIKPWRKTIDAIEQAQLNHDDVNLMIDVLKGDKDAIAEVIKRTGVDALDLDTENSKYVAKDYGRDDNTLALRDVIEEISADKEYETTHKILSKEWDDKSWKVLSSNPEMIKLLHVDVKSGMFQKLQPMAEKFKLYDRGSKSDLEYYEDAARAYAQEMRQMQQANVQREAEASRTREIDAVKAKQQKVVSNKEAAPARKAATPVKKTAGVKKVVDYLDESEEAFEEWYKKVQDKM